MDGPRQRAAAGEQVLKVAAQSGDNGGMIFKFLPDTRLSWRDVRLGAALTAALAKMRKTVRSF